MHVQLWPVDGGTMLYTIAKVILLHSMCLQEDVYIEIVPRTLHCHHFKIPMQPTPAHITNCCF